MVESDFQHQLAAGLRAQGFYCQKWPDSARAIKKPFDLCAAYAGRFIPIECKLKKRNRAKPMAETDIVVSASDFRPQQIPNLLQIEADQHGYPMIAACLTILRPGRAPQCRAWLLPVGMIAAQIETTVARADTLCENGYGYRLERKPSVGWQAPALCEVVGELRFP